MADEVELTDEELELGFYRYEDLEKLRIVENRTDLQRKQDELNFPKPVKTGKSQASFLKVEVHAWMRMRAALRDASVQNAKTPIENPVPSPREARPKKAERRSARKSK